MVQYEFVFKKTRAGLCLPLCQAANSAIPRLLAKAPDKRPRCQRWLLDAGLSSFPGTKG